MAACSILRGIEYRAPCAGERVCADKLVVVIMRVEASVAIAATHNLSGRSALFCVRERKSTTISVCFIVFWFIKFVIFIIIFICNPVYMCMCKLMLLSE